MLRGILEYIEPYDAGKFQEEIARKYGIPRGKIIKLNSNENPYPPPERVLDVIREHASAIGRYPDPSYPYLKDKLSIYTGLPREHIAMGNGASDILRRLCDAALEPLDEVLLPVPTYTMYAFFSMLREATLRFLDTGDRGFKVDARDVLGVGEEAKVVFMCSPNNPTGGVVEMEDVESILEGTKALVVVDEAYSEFHGRSAAAMVRRYDNLVVVRSMSKFFGLAGLRVGYALASEAVAGSLEKMRQPFCISGIAEKAAVAALEEISYFKKKGAETVKEREYLFRALGKIRDLKPFLSQANFILVELLSRPASELMDGLHREGILIRNVSGLPGLKGEYVRITVGKTEENRRLLSALRKI